MDKVIPHFKFGLPPARGCQPKPFHAAMWFAAVSPATRKPSIGPLALNPGLNFVSHVRHPQNGARAPWSDAKRGSGGVKNADPVAHVRHPAHPFTGDKRMDSAPSARHQPAHVRRESWWFAPGPR